MSRYTTDSDVVDNTLDVGRVQLFFEFTLLPYHPPDGDGMEVDNRQKLDPATVRAAMVQYLSPFADSRDKPLWYKDNLGRKQCESLLSKFAFRICRHCCFCVCFGLKLQHD